MTAILNNWLILGIFSCILLGFYDVLKKYALRENHIVIVLFYSSIFGGLLFLPFALLSYFSFIPEKSFWHVSSPNYSEHILIFIKSLLITSVWLLAFKSMQNLPLSIVTPIWATDSIWTFLGAIIIFNEEVTLYQWVALFIIVFSFFTLSKTGQKEGIHFFKNRYIAYLALAIVLGVCGNLYDKYLMSLLPPFSTLAWISFYNILIFFCYKLITDKFYLKHRYNYYSNLNIINLSIIAMIGILVCWQDLAYFYALTLEDSMVSVLTAIKRSSAVIAFLIGAVIFKEHLLKQKFYSLLGIVAGVFLLLVITH